MRESVKAALKDGDAEQDFHPENRNDVDTLTMKLGDSSISGKMDDVEVALLLCDVCDEKFRQHPECGSGKKYDSGRKSESRWRD